jgi:hypothetical protein
MEPTRATTGLITLMGREIALYNELRDIVQHATVVPLTPAPPADGDPTAAWDAISVVSAEADAIILAVETARSQSRLWILPRQLEGTARYRVTSPDGADFGVAEGATLMRAGAA